MFDEYFEHADYSVKDAANDSCDVPPLRGAYVKQTICPLTMAAAADIDAADQLIETTHASTD